MVHCQCYIYVHFMVFPMKYPGYIFLELSRNFITNGFLTLNLLCKKCKKDEICILDGAGAPIQLEQRECEQLDDQQEEVSDRDDQEPGEGGGQETFLL